MSLELPDCTSLILSLMPHNPRFCGSRDWTLVMAEFYHAAARCRPWQNLTFDEYFETLQKTFEPAHKIKDKLQRLFECTNLIFKSGAFIPFPFVSEGEKLFIKWKPYEGLKEISALLKKIASDFEDSNGDFDAKKFVSDTVSNLLANYVERVFYSKEFQNKNTFLHSAFFAGTAVYISSPALKELPDEIGKYLAVFYTRYDSYDYRMVLQEEKTEKENHAQFSLSIDVLIEGKRILLKDAAKKTGNFDVLKPLEVLSTYLYEIEILFHHASIVLNEKRLFQFLNSACGILARIGIDIVLPRTLHRELKPRLALSAEIKTNKKTNLVSYLDVESLLEFKWTAAIGNTILTKEEFKQLLRQKSSIVKWKDSFICIDPKELAALFRETELREKTPPRQIDVISAHLSGEALFPERADFMFNSLFEKKDFPPPALLKTNLRPYQLRGYNWLLSLILAGFGAILADDMGLGKTVQAIAVLLKLRDEKLLDLKSLIAAPAALLYNWENEFSRFAPSVKVSRYHGKNRKITIDDEAEVYLTTPQTISRDIKKISEIPFSLLIVDEAHTLKNSESKTSAAVKKLNVQKRIALSGTPVENRLEDLRALFDFVLPGYLGSEAEFKKKYRVPIEILHSKEVAAELKKITAPFLLRRLKTDKSIISDLPEKVTINEYAVLTKEQAALYQSVVNNNLSKIALAERSGSKDAKSALVLSLLTALKQICGHPRVYDKESKAVSKLSGKSELLLALLPEILASGEKVLIFSQYVLTLECLQEIIKNELKENALIYHGGLDNKKRNETVWAFQNNSEAKVLLISLRAGGLGLNLTAASRVIHYDLWYNPAVETQASDRAFRIGQKRNVFIHRLIVKNSFEEKIDEMLSAKKELEQLTVGTGEAWLSNMTIEELREIFSSQ